MVGYSPPKGGFTTQYPSAWRATTGEDTLDLVPAQDNSGGKRSLSIDAPDIPFHVPGMITLDRVQKGFIGDLQRQYQDVHFDSAVDQAMPGAKARRIKATAKSGGTPMAVDAVIAIHHDQIYIISSECDQTDAQAGSAALEDMLTAWQWN